MLVAKGKLKLIPLLNARFVIVHISPPSAHICLDLGFPWVGFIGFLVSMCGCSSCGDDIKKWESGKSPQISSAEICSSLLLR
jgi:hypothetical protein